MKYYRFPDTKLSKAAFFLFLLVMQMLSRTSMASAVFLGFHKAQFLAIGLIGVAGIAFLFANRKHLKAVFTDSRVMVVIGLVVLMVLGMVVKQDFQMLYFSILLYLLFAVFLTFFVSVQEAATCYVLLHAFLGAYTLIGMFVLKPLVQAGILPGIEFKSLGGWYMYNFGLTYTTYLNNQLDAALRAFGVFREPGLYQIFLFIAIQLNNYTVQWKKQWHMWAVDGILFATLLMTFATGGVLALGLYIVFLFFDKKLYKNKWLCLLAAAAVVAAVALIGTALAQGGTWAYELVGMVEKVINRTSSYTDRIDSVIFNTKTFFAHPIFGDRISDVIYSVTANTATSTILFASFGIVGGCLHVLSWVALAWRKDRNVIMNLILLLILFIPFNTQNVIHDMFFWLFPVMALTEKGIPYLRTILCKGKA